MPPPRSSDPLLRSTNLDDDDQYTPTANCFRPPQHPHKGDTDVSVASRSQIPNNEASALSFPSSTFTPLPTFSEAESSRKDWGDSETHSLVSGSLPPPYDDGDDPTYGKGRENDINIKTPLINFPGISTGYSGDSPQLPKVSKSSSQEKHRRKGITALVSLIFGGVLFILLGLWAVSIIRANSFCRTNGFVSRSYQIHKLSHFEFSDDTMQNSGLPKGFSGTIHILSGPSNQAVDLNVSIRSTASDLQKGTPGGDWRPRELSDCAEVALYFRPSLQISTLKISSKKMKIVLLSDLIVTETTTISLEKGNLNSQNFTSSRRTYIDVHKSTISGAFGLRDLLSIKKESGSLSVDILPQISMDERPQPAVLDIQSKSGTVNINYPPEYADIPNRNYRSTIKTQSGTITGTILHGQETELEVYSGSVKAHILPYGFGTETSSLTTKTQSGSTSIVMLKPYNVPKNMVKRILSNHSAVSGHLSLRYPDEWEGEIQGSAKSGTIQLRGRDVRILTDEARHGHKYIYATKGLKSVSQLKFSIGSGKVDVDIGSE